MSVSVAVFRALIARAVPPADHAVGVSMISAGQATTLTITLAMMASVAVSNLIVLGGDPRRLRGSRSLRWGQRILDWLVPAPAGVLLARLVPTAGWGAVAASAAVGCAYLLSWFQRGRRIRRISGAA